MIRQPIITILAHVDHGKTTLLDTIRKSSVASKEAGGITQCIDATEVPISSINKITKNMIDTNKITIPGLLFVDTPGHEAFSSLRERGGAISDLAILVIDINQGLQPQTRESIEILKNFKVPFVLALNKIDMVHGWEPQDTFSYVQSIQKQSEFVKEEVQKGIYQVMGDLSHYGFDSELFSDIIDYTKTISIIPLSGKTGEGLSELMVVLVGMAQRYLEQKLEIDPSKEAQGTILEVRDEKGLGKVLDVIIYEGSINKGDTVVLGSRGEPVVTKVKVLLKSKPLAESREKVCNFESVNRIVAASVVRLSVQNMEGVISGMPLMTARTNCEEIKEKVRKEITQFRAETVEEGITVKVDTLGSLEAIMSLLRKQNIPIKSAEIGSVSKSDVIGSRDSQDRFHKVVFVFNAKVPSEVSQFAEDESVMVFKSNVIYKLIEDYKEWKKEEEKREEIESMSKLMLPAKVRVLPGFVFRQSKPAVCGVEVLEGRLIKNSNLMNVKGEVVGKAKDIQEQGKSQEKADKGTKIAASIDGAVIGRTIQEGEELWVDVPLEDFKTMTVTYKHLMKDTDIEALRQILEIKRKKEPMWGL